MSSGRHTCWSTRRILAFLTGMFVTVLLASCGDKEGSSDAFRVREREVALKIDELTKEVRDLHCQQRFVELEIESKEFRETFNAWYTEMVSMAPKREGGFSLEPGVIINGGMSQFADRSESETLDLTGMTLIDALNKICELYDVYFCFHEGRIKLSPNADSLYPRHPFDIRSIPVRYPVDPLADPDPFRHSAPSSIPPQDKE